MISAEVRRSFLCLFPTKKSASFLGGEETHVFSLFRFFSTVAAAPTRNLESVALFLKEKGFSDAQMEKVLETRQEFRSVNLEKSIKPKIYYFKEFGFSDSQIAQIITRDPSILHRSLTNTIRPSLSVLRDLLGSSDEAFKVLSKTWSFIGYDLKKDLYPNIEFLKSCGVPMERILLLLRTYPTALCIKPQSLRKHVEKLERLGMDSSSSMFVYGIWAVASRSDQAWELKMQTLRDLGFSDSEILSTFRKAPQVFIVSPEKINSITAAVVATNRYALSSIKAFPACFNYSLEKRLKPRLQVLEILEKRKLIHKWPCLGTVCTYTDERFREAFVAPYPQRLFKGITFPTSGGEKKHKILG